MVVARPSGGSYLQYKLSLAHALMTSTSNSNHTSGDSCSPSDGSNQSWADANVFASSRHRDIDDAKREDAPPLKMTQSRKTRSVTDTKFRVSDTLVKNFKPSAKYYLIQVFVKFR